MDFSKIISARNGRIAVSGIRKVFELGKSLKNPVDFSIGQPDFDVPEVAKEAAIAAIRRGGNTYTVTQGIPELRSKISEEVATRLPGQEREVLITSGVSGALQLAILATVDPGDEVILFDPYFVAYPHMVTLAEGKSVFIDTYPDFQIDVAKVEAAITPRTKVILFSSPANPTGVVLQREIVKQLALLAKERNILLISDEIYRHFHYEGVCPSAAEYDPNVLVVDGFGKSYGMTGWRMGFAHGPKAIIQEMAKLQQFTYVCAPSMAQQGALAAMDWNPAEMVKAYARKRDIIVNGLKDRYEICPPSGAFYVFPKCPFGTALEFVQKAIQEQVLIIPGSVFSQRDTHFRISYATKEETLYRGIEILNRLSR
ncbi:aminotransferase class I/II-fold pyridoxal phosphate-dependent enzyme [Telmatocola sphagniphila]|uniref:Aminotransferase n=1 Tax=Telmatocola sphagniphila TaxID=1123043 RepID=A0A8E6EU21_9BACT|nr:aminotransferase class I/II-fold pyridoxal phosphate-dependent enzyme [Telmatocola sphagniphila]QVL33154.1 aminotransferase class I/II-fold pyridoxal phosphate-dependent enzyme [Telmatocola sphagniphila]